MQAPSDSKGSLQVSKPGSKTLCARLGPAPLEQRSLIKTLGIAQESERLECCNWLIMSSMRVNTQ